MKKLFGISLLAGILLLSGCAITHEYGPYMGKVVEKGTGEPIEGAVVFLKFYTEYPTPGGPNSVFADALEVLTDKLGGFVVPAFRVWVFRPFNTWEPYAPTIIFKPGYGAFPGHSDSEPALAYGAIPENNLVTIKLPRLKTKDERINNLSNLYPGSAPPNAYMELRKLEKYERKETGLDK